MGEKKRGIRRSWIVLVVALAITYGAGIVGSFFVANESNSDWYLSVRPALTPPNWVFPIVWNILYLLIAVSIWLAWTSAVKRDRKYIGWAFGVNLVANALWSILYFGAKQPGVAFIDIIVILGTIIWAMIVCWKIDRRSSWLLLPYLLWVSFASVLNYLSIK